MRRMIKFLVLFVFNSFGGGIQIGGDVSPLDNINILEAIEPVKYDGAQLWRISLANENNKNISILDLQKKLKVSMWSFQIANESASYVDIFVKRSIIENAKSFLEESGIRYEIIMKDVQQAIEMQNPTFDESDLWQSRNGHHMTWHAYHRLSNIYTYLDYLSRTYPNLCSQREIGKSYEGRSLRILRISDGKPTNKAVWIDAGMHAREWISPAVATYIIDNFVENWSFQSQNIRNIDWYFLPVMNPDGYEHTFRKDRLWRKNRKRTNSACIGVDLNRNYGYQWGRQGSSRQPCASNFAGSGPFSEPETKAVENFMRKSGVNFSASISLHSYGQYILYPWGYDYTVVPDYKNLEKVGKQGAAAIKAVNGLSYKVGPASMLYPSSGCSDDWAKGVMNIKYSYTVEMRDTGRYGFLLPASQIRQTGNEMIAFMKVIANAVSRG